MAARTIRIGKNWKSAVGPSADTLRDGGVIIFPTETVYGIGVASDRADALEKMRRLKNRPAGKPFQWLVADMAMAKKFGAVFNTQAERLARSFWPGPMTLVVPDGTGSSTIGIRVPADPFAQALCASLGRPVITSSANPAGSPPPADAPAADCFGDEIDLLIDAGPSPEGLPSTVIRCGAGTYEILRQGGVTEDAVDAAWNGE